MNDYELMKLSLIQLQALAILIKVLEGKPISQMGQYVFQTTQYGSTIWQIVFTASLGTMLRNLAHLLLQRGSRVRV
jgi:uncharacterized membrane protein